MSPEDVTAVSAAVQALSALVIVGLTIWLALTARGALKASDRQARSAADAIEEMRRQRREMQRQRQAMEEQRLDSRRAVLLSSLPVLDVGRPHTLWDGALSTTLRVANATAEPALEVRVEFYLDETQAGDLRHARLFDARPMLPPGEERSIAFDASPIRNLTLTEEQMSQFWNRDEAPPHFGSPELFIVVRCRSVLGSTVIQRYRWLANATRQHASNVWELRAVKILASADDREPVVVDYGDW